MKKILILLALIIGLSCQARIGETREQCDKRYGESEESALGIYYTKNNVRIVARFHEGICQLICYWKMDGDDFIKFEDNEINYLLSINSGKKEFKKVHAEIWKTDRLIAYHDIILINCLTIMTNKIVDITHKKRKKRILKEIEGL